MKKIGIILLLFVTVAFTVKDESQNYVYNIELFPAFAPKSKIEIQKTGSIGKIKLIILKDSFFPKTIENTAVLNEADLKYFSESLNDISLSEMKSDNSMGNDGMTFSNIFIQNGKTTEFEFWSPKKDSKYYKIADAITALLKRKFTEDAEIKYIGKLERHYKR